MVYQEKTQVPGRMVRETRCLWGAVIPQIWGAL